MEGMAGPLPTPPLLPHRFFARLPLFLGVQVRTTATMRPSWQARVSVLKVSGALSTQSRNES
ncbi:hypothetical protein SAMN05216359_104297 [Roseateles sp. YR242]|nr:hypothetical protein SAMN05216359_104297 [Roseateles sp. YR242]